MKYYIIYELLNIFSFIVENYNIDKAKLLIDNGANVNVRDKDGLTPLHIASTTLNMNLVKILVEYGADVNAKVGDSITPLLLAVYPYQRSDDGKHQYDRMFEMVKYLLAHGADPTIAGNYNSTALLEATSDKMVDTMSLLIQYGANVNAKDNDGMTPLHSAAEKIQLEAAKLLMKNGADSQAKDKYEKTPIDSARHTYKYEPVEQEKFDQMMSILEGNVELL